MFPWRRRRFEDARKKVKNGINPVAEMEEAAEERRKAPTVAELCVDYIERHAKKFKRSWGTDERILNHDIIPAWGKRKAADIKKRDVVLILEKIVDRGAPIAVLNHAKQGIIRVYNQFKYDNQKKAALDAWPRKLSAIIGGTKSNVIPFQRKS